MEIPTANDDYETAKQKAKKFYSQIGRVWCPALNEYIVFNNTGFRHLIRKKGIPRSKTEQKRRFFLLNNALSIIKNPNIRIAYQEKIVVYHAESENKKIAVPSPARFWAFTEENDSHLIKVIVRQFQNKEKHFLSIYEKTRKPFR